jgi:hypothetical protein
VDLTVHSQTPNDGITVFCRTSANNAGFRQPKDHHPDVITDLRTPCETLLYLVCEQEGAIEWSADLAAAGKRRLEIIVQVVHPVACRGRQQVS